MRLGISMWSYVNAWKAGELNIPGFIGEARGLGADGVELLDFFYRDVDSERQQAKETMQRLNMPCGVFSVSNNFAKRDPAERAREVDRIRFGVDEARFYGAGVVRVFAGDLADDGPSFEEANRWIIDGLAEASTYAAEHGIKLALENHGRLAGKASQVIGIIEAVRDRTGDDTLGANPDTGNFLLVGEESEPAVRGVARYAYMVHFKDFAPVSPGYSGFSYKALDGSLFTGTVIGEGAVDLGGCVSALRAAGFDGWLNLEYEAEANPFQGVPRSMENAASFVRD